VHAAPADLAFGSKPLAIAVGDVARLAEGGRDPLGIGVRILRPFGGARGGIDPDNAILADAKVAERPGNRARFSDLHHELFLVVAATHCRSTAGWWPHRSDKRTDR